MGDAEEPKSQKSPFPKSASFLVANEFCERFNYYGMRTVLIIYLNRNLFYSQNTSAIIYHLFNMLVYMTCMLGTLVADTILGKYRTILIVSLIYATGSIMLTLGAIGSTGLPPREMTAIGLVLIALGSGGIKPCTASFARDQFNLPEQAKQMSVFFSISYFAMNAGSLLSTVVTPFLREDVYCFGNQHCYPLGFGVPAVFMVLTVVIFTIGRPFYTMKPPEGDNCGLIAGVISLAFVMRYKDKSSNRPPHFLDYATGKYGTQIVEDMKAILRILVLFLPMPLFWALFYQQGSRWIFQATMMENQLGWIGLKSEHMQLVNPLLILIFIPLFEFVLHPLLAYVGIKRPLQKIVLGGLLAALAFVASGFLELVLLPSYGEPLRSGLSQLRIFNGMPNCDYSVKSDLSSQSSFELRAMSHFESLMVPVDGNFTYTLTSRNQGCRSTTGMFHLRDATAMSYFITGENNDPIVQQYVDDPEKPKSGKSHIRVLCNTRKTSKIHLTDSKGFEMSVDDGEQLVLEKADYTLSFDDRKLFTLKELVGDVLTILIAGEGHMFQIIRIVPAKTLNILWQLPQYVFMTMAEVLYSGTGLQFFSSQAPMRMKSVIQACWLLTIAFGNLIVVVIARVKLFENIAYEFFLFAALMVVDMMIFAVLAILYVPYNPTKVVEEEK